VAVYQACQHVAQLYMRILYKQIITFRYRTKYLKSKIRFYDLQSYKQDAQLSQRDRATWCVIVFAKSRTLELGDNDLRTL